MVLRGWGVRVGVVAVIGVVPLAGCSEGAAPVVTPTPTITAPVVRSPVPDSTPTPEPTATELTEEEVLAAIPEAARDESFQGAVAFSRYFVDLYPQMFVPDGRTEIFSALSSSDCAFCTQALSSAQATLERGAYSVGSEFSWSTEWESAQGGVRDDGFWYVAQPFEVTAVTTYAADGSELSADQAGEGTVGLKLAWEGPGWRVHAVEFAYEDAD